MAERKLLAEKVEETIYDDIPADAIVDARRAIRDVVGVTI